MQKKLDITQVAPDDQKWHKMAQDGAKKAQDEKTRKINDMRTGTRIGTSRIRGDLGTKTVGYNPS